MFSDPTERVKGQAIAAGLSLLGLSLLAIISIIETAFVSSSLLIIDSGQITSHFIPSWFKVHGARASESAREVIEPYLFL